MRKYRKYNWPALLKAFGSSGLIQAKFCEENAINPNCFSQKSSEMRVSSLSPFEKIDAEPAKPSPALVTQMGRYRIKCLESKPLESFTAQLHQLA